VVDSALAVKPTQTELLEVLAAAVQVGSALEAVELELLAKVLLAEVRPRT
jgi:hypothetical protein